MGITSSVLKWRRSTLSGAHKDYRTEDANCQIRSREWGNCEQLPYKPAGQRLAMPLSVKLCRGTQYVPNHGRCRWIVLG